ncbi:putative aminoadipate reductase [Mycena pura]|uniref:Aminoadipate reductase n=1 Tax=Mycena pura TaxID=153505 RepID=A0AAD6UTW6_9AGAR|nr:putative aminoadipate reductase [Mycena pura]
MTMLSHRPQRISEVIAWNAKTTPEAPFYVFAAQEGITTITHLEFARAIQRAAHLIRPNREGRDGEVVAVVAQLDTVVYQAVVAGLLAAHMIPLPISPRNSSAAILNLLRTTSCHRVLATRVTLAPLLAALHEEIQQHDAEFALRIEEIPSLSQVYPNLGNEMLDSAFQPYPAAEPPSLDSVCLYLHSSGSTGMPKAIPETHRAIFQWSELTFFTDVRDHVPHPIAVMPIPDFHLSGVVVHLLLPTYGCVPVAVYPPTVTSSDTLPPVPSADLTIEHMRKTKCKAMLTIPAMLIPMTRSPAAIDVLKTLELVSVSGGSLPELLGTTLLDAGVKLNTFYATTESSAITVMVPYAGDERDWQWCRFGDEITIRWVSQGDGTFECQLLNSDRHTLSVENLPDVRGYATSDLWINHPTKKHLWKLVGRIDDIIVHSSGEKTVPAPMEDIVLSSPFVSGVIMFGWEREQAGILIETIPSLQIDTSDLDAVTELRNKLWSIIEAANAAAPTFSRIFKEMIIFTATGTPLPRTGKRSVMRKAALKEYAPEIDALYSFVEKSGGSTLDLVQPPTVWKVQSIQEWLRLLAADLTNVSIEQLSVEKDLFRQGFDSLSATFLRRRIMTAIRSSKDSAVRKFAHGIEQNLVYVYPTVSRLANFFAELASGDDPVLAKNHQLASKELIHSLLEEYASNFASPVPSTAAGNDPLHVVLLTGSTGNLGSEILTSLLENSTVHYVYAFNRFSNSGSMARHVERFRERGLDLELLSSTKLRFIEGQTAEEILGLDSALYHEIRCSVTLIIHNAWKMDFNLSLPSFEQHLVGTRRLVDMALSAARSPRFIFASSIASAASWNSAKGPCPEEVLNEVSDSLELEATGYGQSKFVAEQIVTRSGLRSTACFRIGQVCGPLPVGAWATSDWVPILVKTSLALGCLPLADGSVSWIDFKTVTDAVLDVAFSPSLHASTVFNVVHPYPVPWNSIIHALRDVLYKTRSMELRLVPLPDWFAKLQASASEFNVDVIPGIKLLVFFQHLATATPSTSAKLLFGGMDFATDKLQAISPSVKEAKPLAKEHVEAWVAYWSASRFI